MTSYLLVATIRPINFTFIAILFTLHNFNFYIISNREGKKCTFNCNLVKIEFIDTFF